MMADNNKKLEKIAAAKKKLKQFQSKPKEKEIEVEKSGNDSPQHFKAPSPTNIETKNEVDDKVPEEPPKNVEAESFFNFNNINISNQKEENQPENEFSLKNYFQTDSTLIDFLSEDTVTASLPAVEIKAQPFLNEEVKPISFFSNADHTQESFNIMKENNSETISTISERTENTNDSFLMNDTVELRQDVQEELVNTDSLTQLSAHMSSLLLTEDSFQRMEPTPGSILELEQKNQELACLLQSEKIKNEDLRFKLENQGSLVEELSFEVQKLQLEKSARLDIDVGSLQEQLQTHIQTVGILVGEKSELTASLAKTQTLFKEKSIEADELQSRLNASRYKVQELEKEMSQLRLSCEKLNLTQQKLCTEVENSQEEIKKLSTLYNESSEEIVALNQKLNFKGKEIIALQTEVKQKCSELNMCQLRIEQLTLGETDQSESQIAALTGQKDTYEMQVADYQALTEQLRTEKDQANQQYQIYVQHLNKEMSNLSLRVNELTYERDRLAKREEELVKHVGELEKQLQILMNAKMSNDVIQVESGKDEKLEDEIKKLMDRLKELELEKENFWKQQIDTQKGIHQQLLEKMEQIERLELTIERLNTERPDTKNLMATLESDKVAASRAVSQNQDLKYQLEEMQKAFVQISNDKLELTDRLQTEQHLCREMKIRFTEMENELISLREKFNNKDEEMIRLAHENSELNKEILQQSQELDRLRHYEAGNHLGNMLQIELQNANEQVAALRSRVKDFELERSRNPNHNDENTVHNNEINKEGTDTDHEEKVGEAISDNQSEIMSSSTFMMASHDAMEKLQERFRRTMDEIADLTEEKQKLEHLVTQLQGETETIGEYVTLYQYQRRLLKQREIEKDVELQKLAQDREQMKDKLLYLNSLIEQLLLEKGVKSDAILQNITNNNLNGEISVISPPSQDQHLTTESWQHKKSETQTAVKILNLLSEIKTVNSSMDALQHCPCCSGKLETV